GIVVTDTHAVVLRHEPLGRAHLPARRHRDVVDGEEAGAPMRQWSGGDGELEPGDGRGNRVPSAARARPLRTVEGVVPVASPDLWSDLLDACDGVGGALAGVTPLPRGSSAT